MKAIDKYLYELNQKQNYTIPPELKRIVKNNQQRIDGDAGTCIIYSDKTVLDRMRYHDKYNTVESNFVFFAILSFKNTPKSAKLLPDSFFEDEKGLAEGASLYYFYNVNTRKIAQFYMEFEQGSGYTKGFKWKPKDVNYVSLNNFIPFMKKITKRGVNKSMSKYLEELKGAMGGNPRVGPLAQDYYGQDYAGMGEREDAEGMAPGEKKRKYYHREAEGMEGLPRGWTNQSVKKFAKSLTGKGAVKKGFFDKCVEKVKGKFDNPESFCAAIKDEVEGSTYWRGKGKSEKEAERETARKQNVKQD